MKLKNALMLMTGSMILFVLACTAPPAEPTMDLQKVTEEISAISQTWAKGINERDTEAILALFADDANFYPANKPPRVGKAAMKAALETGLAQDTTDWTIAFVTNEVIAAGDYANEMGSWTVTGPDGNTADKGNYIVVYKKQDGKYMVLRDMYNSEMPKEKPEPMAEAVEAEAGE